MSIIKKINQSYRIQKLVRSVKKKIQKAQDRIDAKPIKEELPRFDELSFKKKVESLDNGTFKNNLLSFLEDGYLVVEQSVGADVVDNAVIAFYNWKKRNASKMLPEFYKYNERLDRVSTIHSAIPECKALFAENTSLPYLDFLFGQETVLLTSLFFEVGSEQDIHRDEPLFWTQPAHYYFGTWLALEDTDANNGPLIVIPGSHKINPNLIDKLKIANQKYDDLKKIDPADSFLWENYQKEIQNLCVASGLSKKEVHVKKGDTIIWHPLLAHGGAAVKDQQRTRLSFVMHTIPYEVPIFGMKIFFNPAEKVRTKARLRYETLNNRKMVYHNYLRISNRTDFDFSKFK
jgi:phytanoyl-CoA hydroxylase